MYSRWLTLSFNLKFTDHQKKGGGGIMTKPEGESISQKNKWNVGSLEFNIGGRK